MKLLIVTASVREGRVGARVADWFANQVEQDGRFEAVRADLKELNLSYELPEALPATVLEGQYEQEATRVWAQYVKDADAVVFVSPEYNHGMPASLKNALDHLYLEWINKPAGFVGYGAAGAPYSQAALGLVAGWLKLDIVSARVGISEVWAAFNENDELNFADYYARQATTVLDALAKKVEAKK